MPVVYRCSYCGAPLEIFVKVGQNSYGVPTPAEVSNKYGGYCYYCNRPLNIKPTIEDVEIYVEDAKERMAKFLEEAKRQIKIRFLNLQPFLSRYLDEFAKEVLEEAAAIEAGAELEEGLSGFTPLSTPRTSGEEAVESA